MMTEKELLELIKQGEGSRIELKSSLADSDRIVEVASSMANSSGGYIIIGIGSKGDVLGVQIGNQTIEQLTNRIIDNTDPRIYPRIEVISINGKNVIIISVRESSDKPHLAFGRLHIRINKITRLGSRNEYNDMLQAAGKINFDGQLVQEANYDVISEEKVKEFLQQRAVKLNVAIPRISIEDFLLRTIKVVKEKNGKLIPTNAALLFFGQNPQECIPQAEVKIARFKGATMVEFLDSAILKGTFYEILDSAERFIKRNTRLASKILNSREWIFQSILMKQLGKLLSMQWLIGIGSEKGLP